MQHAQMNHINIRTTLISSPCSWNITNDRITICLDQYRSLPDQNLTTLHSSGVVIETVSALSSPVVSYLTIFVQKRENQKARLPG